MYAENTQKTWLDRPLFKANSILRIETLLSILIIIITLLSRFTVLGERVMSHDEVNHVVPSWELYSGKGYVHTPVTHGPFQFHIVALTYFLFGDNDYTSRIPAAMFSSAAVIFVLFAFRRYLGKTGAILSAIFFMVSPFMLFYGRYTRNEGFIELFGVVMLFAVLRYMDKGDKLSLFLLTGSIVFHFAAKETAFIYVAQLLIFLMILFITEIYRAEKQGSGHFNRFIVLIFLAMMLVFGAIGLGYATAKAEPAAPAEAAAIAAAAGTSPLQLVSIGLVVGALAAGAVAFLGLLKDLSWAKLRQLRSFSLLLLTSTLILPQLAAFPVKLVGWDPLDYSSSGLLHTSIFLVLFLLISAAIGLLWNAKTWLQHAFFFYAVYIFLYTTMFTNGNGFFTGIIGSLGYWLSQQGVNRGGQPVYYFALIQMPIYEYLAVFGTVIALYFGLRYDRFYHLPGHAPAEPNPPAPKSPENTPAEPVNSAVVADTAISDSSFVFNNSEIESMDEPAPEQTAARFEETATLDIEKFYQSERAQPILAMLIFWAFTSLVAYSLAGEKMPWLTVHITMGFLLAAGWGIGYLIDSTDWKQIATRSGAVALCLLPLFFTSASGLLGGLLGSNPPFAGNTLDQLQSTSRFIFAVICLVGSAGGILYLLRAWHSNQILRLFTLTFLAIMLVLTGRAAYRASFVNYDNAMEFLVYAHAARGPKDILAQVEEISRRTTKGKDLEVAYSGDGLYPYWWYLRDYPNHRWFGDKPTRDLKEVPVIIAGDDAASKMAPIVGENYVKFDYMRLWWPMQGYYNLTAERLSYALSNPEMRAALWDIWFNRDYTKYAKITSDNTLTLENWQPSARVVLYVRKDIIAQIWNYGTAPTIISAAEADPYQSKLLLINSDRIIGLSGSNPGALNTPRSVAVGPDGSVYAADSRNHRIQRFSAEGELLNYWGSFADASTGKAPGETFNEPWGVAVGPDGSVYVTDTWNHRVQQFTADGKFVRMWGYFGQAEKPEAFWGPRGIAVDSKGKVYVTDTGNKRVVIFDKDGVFISQFGTSGVEIGQFDEPVGVAVGEDGAVYVLDTWNQRIQVFTPDPSGANYSAARNWAFSGWDGQSLDNKPFLAVSPTNGHLMVADPEKSRVLEFDDQGTFIRGWGAFSNGPDGFGLASGVAVDAKGGVWVSDGGNHRLLHFVLP
jgi:predicted membrane-bound mannosyltransferase/DNA-binding beta-propeller fold protein YncE